MTTKTTTPKAYGAKVSEAQQPTSPVFDQQLGWQFATDNDKNKYFDFKKKYERYAYINISGKPAIVSRATNSDGETHFIYSSPYDFETFNKDNFFYVLDDNNKLKKIRFATHWLENPAMRHKYEYAVFEPKPGFNDKSAYNFWTGYIPRIKGDVKPFTDFIDNLIVGTPDERMHLIKLLAFTVQFPHINTGTAVVLRGPQGGGKSTVSEILGAICPNHYATYSSVEKLFGFNGESVSYKYFGMEEAIWSGKQETNSRLKDVITNKKRNIEIKNLTAFQVKNYGFYIFTSNGEKPVPIDPDDRRFNIYECAIAGDRAYFKKFYEWLNAKGKHIIMDYFMSLNLSDFDHRHTISNKAKLSVKTANLDVINRYVMALLAGEAQKEDGTPLMLNETNPSEINRAVMFASFKAFNNFSRGYEVTTFSKRLSEIFEFPANWANNWNKGKGESRINLYKFPCLIECQKQFAKKMKCDAADLFENHGQMTLDFERVSSPIAEVESPKFVQAKLDEVDDECIELYGKKKSDLPGFSEPFIPVRRPGWGLNDIAV